MDALEHYRRAEQVAESLHAHVGQVQAGTPRYQLQVQLLHAEIELAKLHDTLLGNGWTADEIAGQAPTGLADALSVPFNPFPTRRGGA